MARLVAAVTPLMDGSSSGGNKLLASSANLYVSSLNTGVLGSDAIYCWNVSFTSKGESV